MQPPKLRTIVELELFKARRARLGYNVQTIDEALQLFLWGLCKNPQEFGDAVPGMPDCYIGRTRPRTTSDGVTVPMLRVFFRVKDDDTVLLASISKYEKP